MLRGRGIFDAGYVFEKDYKPLNLEELKREIIQIKWVLRNLDMAENLLMYAVLEFWSDSREPLEQIRTQLMEYHTSVKHLNKLICDEATRRDRDAERVDD